MVWIIINTKKNAQSNNLTLVTQKVLTYERVW